MKGKLIEIKKKESVPGTQDTYNGVNGLLYKFWATFDCDGAKEVGEVAGKTPTSKLKVGNVYTFDKKVNGAQGQFISFSNVKDVDAVPFVKGGGKSGGIEFARQKALEAAFDAIPSFWCSGNNKDNLKPEIYFSPGINIFKHITATGVEQDIWYYIAAVRSVVDKIDRVEDFIKIEGKTSLSLWLDEIDKVFNIIKQTLVIPTANDNQSEPH